MKVATPKKSLFNRRTVPNPKFAKICSQRADEKSTERYSVASNGKIIEQQQILTTQNLAAIYTTADLGISLAKHHTDMANKCLKWIYRQLQIPTNDFHTQLVFIKNSAYAWRQMIFFLSFEDAGIHRFSKFAWEYLNEQSPEFQVKFSSALAGLDEAIKAHCEGKSLGSHFLPFVGWTTKKHWFIEKTFDV